MPALPSPLPDPRRCERARLSRDARFDGLFFTAVTSTRIYCRPVCPAPPPKPAHVRYYASAAAAEADGFRPCLRCRPELAPDNALWRRGEHAVARALTLIEHGALEHDSVEALATRLGMGARQLRRLFVAHVGVPPLRVHATRRLLFARQLLTETAMPVTEVAMAAGFASLRRFNAAFAQAHRMAPRDVRRLAAAPVAGAPLVLKLGYRPPYDFAALLAFLRGRALPGVEAVDEASYARVFGDPAAPSWLRVAAGKRGEHALRLELYGVPAGDMLGVVTRLRRLFDLDAAPQAISAAFGRDALLGPLVRRHPGQRLPGGWDGFEIAVRAILGQQVSVAAARTLAARLATRFGTPVAGPPQPALTRLFPTPAQLVDADLGALGITGARIATLRGVAHAVLEGRVDFRPEQSLEEFVARWVALPGIGAWTAHYVAMRALGHPDAFPAADLILRRAASPGADALGTRALEQRAEAWRPWRAYAVMHLWRSVGEAAVAAGARR